MSPFDGNQAFQIEEISGSVNLRWLAGTMNPADLFTKNVNTSLLQMHRARLGFVVVQDVPQGLFQLSLGTHCKRRWPADGGMRIALLEACCAEESGLSRACHESNTPYAGVTGNMQMGRVFASAFDVVKIRRKQGHWIHVHVSTPCSSGSPLKRFQIVQQVSISCLEMADLLNYRDTTTFGEDTVRNRCWTRLPFLTVRSFTFAERAWLENLAIR